MADPFPAVTLLDGESLKSILSHLPRQQHDIAKRKILLAESVGFRHIFLWFSEPFTPDHYDLCGTNAVGDFDFLAEPGDYTKEEA